MDTTQILFNSLNLIVITITAIAIWRTLNTSNKALKISNDSLNVSMQALNSNHEWNRRKTTHEILDKFIIGDIPDLNSKIKIEFNCKITSVP